MYHLNTVSIYTEPCQRVATPEECETFAIQLSLTDTTATVIASLLLPPYCYYNVYNDEDKKLWFNTAVQENTSPCTDIRMCVCKNGIKNPSGKIKQELISNHFPWKLVDYKQR